MSQLARLAVLILALTVLSVSCSDDSGGVERTTSTAGRSPTTTSTPPITAPAEVEIPEQGILKLQPGTAYLASDFWAPVSFTVSSDGWWWARGATDLWVHLEYHEGGGSIWDLDLSAIVSGPTLSSDDLVSEIVSDGYLEVISEPMATTVGNRAAVVFDVFAPDAAGSGDRLDSCVDPEYPGNSRFFQLHEGFHLMGDWPDDAVVGGWGFGVRECRAARIWVVDVDGSTIAIIAAAANQELFDALIPAAEQLLAGIEFDH